MAFKFLGDPKPIAHLSFEASRWVKVDRRLAFSADAEDLERLRVQQLYLSAQIKRRAKLRAYGRCVLATLVTPAGKWILVPEETASRWLRRAEARAISNAFKEGRAAVGCGDAQGMIDGAKTGLKTRRL